MYSVLYNCFHINLISKGFFLRILLGLFKINTYPVNYPFLKPTTYNSTLVLQKQIKLVDFIRNKLSFTKNCNPNNWNLFFYVFFPERTTICCREWIHFICYIPQICRTDPVSAMFSSLKPDWTVFSIFKSLFTLLCTLNVHCSKTNKWVCF